MRKTLTPKRMRNSKPHFARQESLTPKGTRDCPQDKRLYLVPLATISNKPRFAWQQSLVLVALIVCLGIAQPASADIFAFDLDGQIGYSQLQHIRVPQSNPVTTQKLSDMAVGARAKLKLLFLCLMADYQHFAIKNADYLHAGLGVDFGLPLGVVKPYVRGSVGLMLLAAKAGAFNPKADANLDATAGAQARAGIGLDILLGNWFAVGASFDFGYHYITSHWGYDLSAMGYVGLRI